MIVDAQRSPAARNLVRVFFMRFKQPVSVGDVVRSLPKWSASAAL